MKVEKTCFWIGLCLIAVVIGIQTYVFINWHDGREYSGDGEHMTENTWLFRYDRLTVSVQGEDDFGEVWLYRNGERVEEILNEAHSLNVKENDLIQLKSVGSEVPADIENLHDTENLRSVEVQLEIQYNIFDSRFYVDLFDFHGGTVTVGRFIPALE